LNPSAMKEAFETFVDHLLEKGFFMQQAVEILERTLMARALERTEGNRSESAKLLGIHRNTLQRKIEDYKLEGQRPRKKPVHQAKAVRRRVKAG
jgi:DNA-binding NtrC family response regulator